MTEAVSPWRDALAAAAMLAVDPHGLGGAVLRGLAGPIRETWLDAVRAALPPGAPWRRVPLGVADDRLLGGLDLAATLRAGRPVVQRGILAAADGGIAVLAMAERIGEAAAARLGAVLDAGEVAFERDGFAQRHPARLGVIALDEGLSPEERPPSGLLDRLAFRIGLDAMGKPGPAAEPYGPDAVAAARELLPRVRLETEMLEALCATAAALGIASLRAPLLAARAARIAAALAGRAAVSEADAALAARLVLAPRATRLPQPAPEPPPQAAGEDRPPEPPGETAKLDDTVLAAAAASIPPGLLARLAAGTERSSHAGGRTGAAQPGGARGRPAGVRRGEPGRGGRLNLIETLRAAAPWQRLRQPPDGSRVAVRRDDFRITRLQRPNVTTTIFAVDASGSQALHRLAEAKGAVELLLAECYARRDQVALLAFRGAAAELILPPTRALARARRSLAALPGGGGTPLAAGIDAAAALAGQVRRRGETPVIVLLTDGRANIARDGAPGRPRAEADALAAARRMAAEGQAAALLVDTSPMPHPAACRLAEAMAARYVPLPRADAAALSRAARALG